MSNFEPMKARRTPKIRVNRDSSRGHRAKQRTQALKQARKRKATR